MASKDSMPQKKKRGTLSIASEDSRLHKKKSGTRTIADVKRLGHELLSSRSNINNLPLLLKYVSPTSLPQYTLESLLSLQPFFTTVLSDLPPSSSKPPADAAADRVLIYRTWLRSKFDEFLNSLVEVAICSDCDEPLREIVLDSIMEFVKLGNRGRFYSALYHKLLQNIVCSALPIEFLIELLASKYFKYVDIRYFTYISIDKLAKTLETWKSSGGKYATANGADENNSKSSQELSVNKMHFLLSHIPPLGVSNEEIEYELWTGPEFLLKEGDAKKNPKGSEGRSEELKEEKSNKKNISKRMRLKFTRAWMSFLRLPLPLDVYKEVLVNLHQAVIPCMSNPAMLCDFLTRSYDIGGVVSVMALSGLFILMTQYGLEYSNFYEKLYALLVPSVFMAKHRAKFFELLDSCLKSPLLPAYLAAAFTKRLSRLSLVVPPSGAMIIIALVHNLLLRHPSINCLVQDKHTITESAVSNEKRGVDHFNDEECDPRKTNALKSSLWEIDSLRHHYCPHVSRFVLSLENDLTVRAKTSEITIKDFSSGSYSTIFKEEMRRRVKQVPLAFYKATPTSLFSENDFPSWTFKYDKQEEEACA